MKKVFAILLIVMLLFSLSACSKPSEASSDKPILIGLSLDSLVVERWQRDMEIIVANANQEGYEVDVRIANENVERQISQIEDMINSGVKVLIILPNDADSLSEVIQKAKRQGIYVIAYDRLIKNAPVDLYISFDNRGIGKSLAKELIGKSDLENRTTPLHLAIINGDPKDNNAHLLNQGYYDEIRTLVVTGKIEVVTEVWANEWREAVAKSAIEELVLSEIPLDGIIAANDVLATGAIHVLSEFKLAGDVIVVSQDAELSACQRIVEGTQLATIYKPINDLANETVSAAVQVLNGNEVAYGETIWNGEREVPFKKLEFQVVNEATIKEIIIDSGFHSAQDVYLHVNQQ
ncbi:MULTISPECIES: sugar ABC transporter substrate-binding protein [unclassified Fusibacter]|uniref:sugar ABC transporter substrate-binding protein n=1 Tax=unclassified Fusibacter TaxID=2624464 RepID=UPI001012CE11|nr:MULTISPECIES: substrate-binding domain-containing protein [unclassified Fusibacter]MCK8059663.1 substrate-binding domain-containing protein [Fusibacter sp. A2]NPE21464.1 sugar ABC transporter substrate-binding protein [Fusibacter sp. A1]RXV61875.1 D-xylose transporter subunit XylF [Fusibacter sp. A1]